jgi:Site-specific recombinases, DNA invertase Pin homologs
LEKRLNIAAYCRISVDEEMDRENTSIENQKAIIADFATKKFPGAALHFYEDRDRSGYTFEQREGYQQLRPQLMGGVYDILLVKDFSRFSRRNSKGLVELEDLRDAGIRIISIGDSIDYPTFDDWTAIQFRFLINEMPVTDTSRKVKSVIRRRQSEGKWICSVPYGYRLTDSKAMEFELDEAAAEVVREIFGLYNAGWGYKKIANHLTDKKIPTPRMCEKMRKERTGERYNAKVGAAWSIVTVSDMLCNDFYIGTLRQGKYRRKKINGRAVKTDEAEQVVFEKNHEPIIEDRVFALAREQRKKRASTNYRGIKKYDNVYSGFLYCGDCGSPMFSMSRKDLAPAYTCGSYHTRGRKGCTSHHTRVDLLDQLLKAYVQKVKDNSASMLSRLNESLKNEPQLVWENTATLELLHRQLGDTKAEMKMLARQQAKELLRNPDRESAIDEIYREVLDELADRLEGLDSQIALTVNRRNKIVQLNRVAKTALEIFDDLLGKDKLDKTDLDLMIEKITVYEDHLEISLKADIDALLASGELAGESGNFRPDTRDSVQTQIVQASNKHADKVFRVSVISDGDPLEIYTDNDGEVIFKKYSPLGELGLFSTQYAEVLHRIGGHSVLVCDRDHVIAVSGIPKKEMLERRVSTALEDSMEQRKSFVAASGGPRLQPVEGVSRYAIAAAPIIAAGDVCGSVMFLAEDNSAAGEVEIKLVAAASAFLGKQMEE